MSWQSFHAKHNFSAEGLGGVVKGTLASFAYHRDLPVSEKQYPPSAVGSQQVAYSHLARFVDYDIACLILQFVRQSLQIVPSLKLSDSFAFIILRVPKIKKKITETVLTFNPIVYHCLFDSVILRL
jgi:hypothetical protein